MTHKHSPAPWEVVYGANGAAVCIRDASGPDDTAETNGAVGSVVRKNGIGMPACSVGIANARLMAAAPDMLKALEQWTVAMKRINSDRDASAALEEAERLTDIAIRKATLPPEPKTKPKPLPFPMV